MIKKNLVFSLFFALISPICALYFQFGAKNKTYLHYALTMFITIYGSTITVGESTDGHRHWQNVYTHYQGLSFSQFMDEVIGIIQFNPSTGVKGDLFIHFYSYLLALLQLEFLFFVLVSFIYGYFFSGTLLKIFYHKGKNYENQGVVKYTIILAFYSLLFIIFQGIDGMHTVRTWTGMWILLYAVISYYQSFNKKYLFLLLLPPMFHVGYFVMMLPSIFIILFGDRYKYFYVLIFAFSLFFNASMDSVTESLQTTELGKSKVQAYYVEDEEEFYDARVESNQTWYKKYERVSFSKYGFYIIIFTIILTGLYFKKMTKLEMILFSIGLLTIALANYSSFIYALGNRSRVIGNAFILSCAVLLLRRNLYSFLKLKNYKLHLFSYLIAIPILFPIIIYKMGRLLEITSIYFIGLPFLAWLFPESNYSLREMIGWFL